jgi:hypothetical protein
MEKVGSGSRQWQSRFCKEQPHFLKIMLTATADCRLEEGIVLRNPGFVCRLFF